MTPSPMTIKKKLINPLFFIKEKYAIILAKIKEEREMYNILVVDDDKEIVGAIEIYLKNEGYNVIKAYNGEEALKKIKENEIHLIILDIMMPKKDGIETLGEIRKTKTIPVILLSAKSEDYDKIEGLNQGADDYITKPFNPLELIARVNSNIRRYVKFNTTPNETQKNVYQAGELIIDDDTKKVIVEGKEVKLTGTEFNILKFLLKNKGKVYSIEQIYENVWNEEGYGAENIIAVHIRHIREKIEINPKEPKYLKVIWGVGYKIEDKELM